MIALRFVVSLHCARGLNPIRALALAPLLYASMSGERPLAVAAQILLWWGLAILAMLWTARTRELRGDMTVDEVFAAADADLLAAKAARRAASA